MWRGAGECLLGRVRLRADWQEPCRRHHLCSYLRARLVRRRPCRLVDDVQRNRINERVTRRRLRRLLLRRPTRCHHRSA